MKIPATRFHRNMIDILGLRLEKKLWARRAARLK